MCPPGTIGWGLGEDPSDLGALMHRTGCHPVPSVLNSCLKLRQAPSRVPTRTQSPRPGPAGAYTSSAPVVPAGIYTSSPQGVRVHIEGTKWVPAHQARQVCACVSSGQSVRKHISARSVRTYTPSNRNVVVRTKRISTLIHQAHEVREHTKRA